MCCSFPIVLCASSLQSKHLAMPAREYSQTVTRLASGCEVRVDLSHSPSRSACPTVNSRKWWVAPSTPEQRSSSTSHAPQQPSSRDRNQSSVTHLWTWRIG